MHNSICIITGITKFYVNFTYNAGTKTVPPPNIPFMYRAYYFPYPTNNELIQNRKGGDQGSGMVTSDCIELKSPRSKAFLEKPTIDQLVRKLTVSYESRRSTTMYKPH